MGECSIDCKRVPSYDVPFCEHRTKGKGKWRMLDYALGRQSFRWFDGLGICPVNLFLLVGNQRGSTRTIRGNCTDTCRMGNRMVGDCLVCDCHRCCRDRNTFANLHMDTCSRSSSIEKAQLVWANFCLSLEDRFGSPRVVAC